MVCGLDTRFSYRCLGRRRGQICWFSTLSQGMGTNTALPIFAYYTKYINADDSLHISQDDFEVPETMLKSPLDCPEKEDNNIQLGGEINEDSWGLNDDNW